MTKIANEKQSQENAGGCLPGLLLGLGILLLIGGAGNSDAMDAMEAENRSLGYEKNIIGQDDYKTSNKTMVFGGFLTAAGALGLLRKERNGR